MVNPAAAIVILLATASRRALAERPASSLSSTEDASHPAAATGEAREHLASPVRAAQQAVGAARTSVNVHLAAAALAEVEANGSAVGQEGVSAASTALAASVAQDQQVRHHEARYAEDPAPATGGDKNETAGGDDKGEKAAEADDEPAPVKEKEEELEKEEKSSLGGGLATMTTALTDPRKFMLGLPGMKEFVAGLKVAVDLQSAPDKGKCLMSTEFANFGCADDSDSPKVCSCRSIIQLCYTPEDPQAIVKRYSSGDVTGAMEEGKAMLFGKCYTSMIMISILGGASLLGLTILYYVAKSALGGKGSDDSRNSDT